MSEFRYYGQGLPNDVYDPEVVDLDNQVLTRVDGVWVMGCTPREVNDRIARYRETYEPAGRNPHGKMWWRTRLLHLIGRLVGVQFHIGDHPYGASWSRARNTRWDRNHPDEVVDQPIYRDVARAVATAEPRQRVDRVGPALSAPYASDGPVRCTNDGRVPYHPV